MRSSRWVRGWFGFAALALTALVLAACTREVEKPVVQERVVVKEVEVPVVKEVEVIKEVPVERQVVVEKQVIKEVPVEKIVEKVVVKEVPVEKQVVVTKEVVKEVPKEVVVVKEVVKEVVKQVVVEVPAKAKEKALTWARGVPGTIMPHNQRGTRLEYDLAFSFLLTPDPVKQEWSPGLAERWSISPDGTSWTFFIRKGAKWHDGVPVTAKDIAFTLKSYLTPATVSRFLSNLQGIKGALEYVDGKATEIPGIVVMDDYTVRVDLKEPDAFFPLKLTGVAGHAPVPMLPAHVLGAVPPKDLITNAFFNSKPIGSGPFKIVTYKAGEVMEFVANDDYYFGRPKIDRIIMRDIKTPDVEQIAYQRGELDMSERQFEPEVYGVFLNDPRYIVIGTVGNVQRGYTWNYRAQAGLLRDPRVHQAFLHAIDRQALIDQFLGGNGTVTNTGMTHPWYAKPEWNKLYPYDPDKARALLRAAGWDSNRKVSVLIASSYAAQPVVAAEQAYLKAVGFNIEFNVQDGAAADKIFAETREWDLFRGGSGLSADPDGWATNRFSLLGVNVQSYGNDAFEKLILAGRRGTTQAERAKIYQEMNEKYLLVELPHAPIYTDNFYFVKARRFKIPLFAAFPEPKTRAAVVLHPTFVGKDHWSWHPEQWDIVQ